MIDKLIEYVLQFWDSIKFWEVIPHYDRGVRLRIGVQKGGELSNGLHWKIPFADDILTIMVKTTTMRLPEQTVTTKDNTPIVVKAVVKYEIKDACKVLLEVNDPIDAVADMTQGIIRNKVIESNYDECNTLDFSKEITTKAKSEARRWGIQIEEVTLTDLGRMTSIRLLNTQVQMENNDLAK